LSVYPDASLIVSAYVEEVTSELAERWLASLSADRLATSAWCSTEIASALAKKVRMGSITSSGLDRALGAIAMRLAAHAKIIPVEQRHFDIAAGFALRSRVMLRAGDALHLAIASEAGTELVTLDRKMAEAGQALGLGTRLLA
jgi:hypothetical protein